MPGERTTAVGSAFHQRTPGGREDGYMTFEQRELVAVPALAHRLIAAGLLLTSGVVDYDRLREVVPEVTDRARPR